MPKSSSGPPGLCDAVSTIPPYAAPPSRSRMIADAAGVESRPPRPTHTRATPFAAAIRQIVWIAAALWYRPSPETTSVVPASSPAGSESKSDCTKFSRCFSPWKTFVFLRRPDVPGFWPSIGSIGTTVTAADAVHSCTPSRRR